MNKSKPKSKRKASVLLQAGGRRRPVSGSPRVVYMFFVNKELYVPVWANGPHGKSYVRLRCPQCHKRAEIDADMMRSDMPSQSTRWHCCCGAKVDAAQVYDLSE